VPRKIFGPKKYQIIEQFRMSMQLSELYIQPIAVRKTKYRRLGGDRERNAQRIYYGNALENP
jgi:hypothetical protein